MRILGPATFLFFSLLFANYAWAQHTLFNVPSSERTDLSGHYLQLQDTLDFPDHRTNLTYDYGLSENLEVGLNVTDVTNASPEEGGKSTDYLVNGQYFVNLSDMWQVSAGTQLGHSHEGEFSHYSFLNFKARFGSEELFFVFGFFDANSAYLEGGDGFWHAGVEIPIKEKKIDFFAEYINGTSDLSDFSTGFAFQITEKWEVALGYQLPGFQNSTDEALIMEVTYR